MSELTITLVRSGAFSGSALSLRDALRHRAVVHDHDVTAATRQRGLWFPRLAALAEARRHGGVPFAKTAAWSKGLQATFPEPLRRHPIVFVQTIPAFEPEPLPPYVIYSDRLGREGMTSSSRFRSRATPGWVEREANFVAGARHLFVMGPSTRRFAVDRYGIEPERVTVAGGAPNAPVGLLRESSQCRRLLFVGTQQELKGLPELLEAFELLLPTNPDLELEVVGDVPQRPVPKKVVLVGRVAHDRMPSHYARSDLLVIPTHMEAFGIALVEALCTGIPVVGTNIGNQQWIMGDAGLTVEPGDVGGLARAIQQIIDHYPVFKERAEQRREELLRSMSWDAIAGQIVEALTGAGATP